MTSFLPAFKKLPRPVRYVAICALAALAGIYLINSRYARLEIAEHHFYDDAAQKIWAHRGYAKKHAENTLEAFQDAVDRGAPGIEVDIFYDPATKHFLVTNEAPSNNDPSLRLKDIFLAFGEKTHYWLNFINLADLGYADSAGAAHLIARMATRYTKRPLVMVESSSPSHLSPFKSLGIHTTLSTTFDPDSSWLVRQYQALKLKYLLGTNGITGASFVPAQFDQDLSNQLTNTDIYILTANTLEEARQFATSPTVKIILTDEDFYTLDDL